MALFEYNITNHVDLDEVLKKLDQVLKNQRTMGKELDELKAKLVIQDEKVTAITSAADGLQADLTFIKAKLEASAGGIDAAGVAELNGIVDASQEKLTAAVTKIQELDAQTDPNA